MKVFQAASDVQAMAIDRVVLALTQYAPETVEFVTDRRAADLVVIHVAGRRDQVLDQVETCDRLGQRYAVLQYVLRSTQKPHTSEWVHIWEGAALTWSYLDLKAMCREDEVPDVFDFYHAPLGVDDPFRHYRVHEPRDYLILTSGRHWLNESVKECVLAARAVNRPAVHLGKDLRRSGVTCVTAISDHELAGVYRNCEYVSGLRRIEGFELPAAEGLLCGARPVLFDQPWYRHWYGDLAEYVPEGDRPDVWRSLIDLFARGPVRSVTRDEHLEAADRFHWPRLVGTWWSALQ